MNKQDLEEEFFKLDMEGFSYWLMNYFNSEESPFEGEILKLLEDAAEALSKAEDALKEIRTKYGIEYS